ncbi:sensor histidine kinase [Dyadobacter pollutisoli]|uniref:histidine kinase n=1 Tax=Dyadobacter pollutisoli TaxID=2910158 RepID=A0A9E8NFJ2_9BACT|nr:ATP-binding protein [Dyadobacter pollutisoli]WAC14016.1 histidine kinase [Dyadobacter pollutisoli]
MKQRQIVNNQEKASIRAQFEHEILKAQNEVKNNTLQQIGQELHDNIGQLLSIVRINLNVVEEMSLDIETLDYIKQTSELVALSIQEVRSLSKSLDGDFVQQFGLIESITHDLQRIRKTNKFLTEITVEGEPFSLGYEKEIVLFRVTQEILNNMMKHSAASNVTLSVRYSDRQFLLSIKDNGKGFDYAAVMKRDMSDSGSGLRNILRRCNLIGAECIYESVVGSGTSINITMATNS